MQERKSLTRVQNAKRLAADPFLSDFASPFPSLASRDKGSTAASFERMAEFLSTGERAATVQFTINDGKAEHRWCLALTPDSCKVSQRQYQRPDLEVITHEEVWLAIATGDLSPLEAFGQGKLRVRGDIALARFIARKMQGAKETR